MFIFLFILRIFISVTDSMFYLTLVCLKLHIKTTTWIFMKILPETCLWTRQSIESVSDLDPDLGIFGRNFYYCGIPTFIIFC